MRGILQKRWGMLEKLRHIAKWVMPKMRQHAKAARDDHAAAHELLVQCQNPALSCGLAKAHAPGDGVQLERAPQTSPIAK